MDANEKGLEWRTSARGNSWTKAGDHLLVVGQSPFGAWLSIDGEFTRGTPLKTLDEAKALAEKHIQLMEGNKNAN